MFTHLHRMINDAQRAGVAYRRVIDRTIGFIEARRSVSTTPGRPETAG